MNRSDDAFGAPTRQTTISPLVISCILVAFAFIPDLQAPQSTTWFVLTASVVALCWRLWVDQASIRWGIPATCVLLFYGCQAVAVVNYGELRDLGAALFSAAVVTLIILLSSSFRRRQINVLVNGILALSVVELGFALAEQYLHLPAPRGYIGGLVGSTFGINPLLASASGRTPGTLGHAIPLGTLMAVAALLIIFAKSEWKFPVRLLASLPFVFGILLSGTRSAIIGLAAAGLIGIFLPRIFKHPTAWRTAIAAVAVVALLTVNLSALPVFSTLDGTGSLEHRTAALSAFWTLTDRDAPQVIFGSGYGSSRFLFYQGLLQGDGFFAIDNQLVTAFALAGVVGLAALLVLVLFGFVKGHRPTRPAAILLVGMFFSFDLLQWTFMLVLFAALIALGSQIREPARFTWPDLTPASIDPTTAANRPGRESARSNADRTAAWNGPGGNTAGDTDPDSRGSDEWRYAWPTTPPLSAPRRRLREAQRRRQPQSTAVSADQSLTRSGTAHQS